MNIFKKNQAVQVEKLNIFKDILINEKEVKLHINYSGITISLEEVPKLLADAMQLYTMVKPMLDKKTIEKMKDKTDEADSEDTIIDLSDIPF